MNLHSNNIEFRILIYALILSIGILSYACYDAYASEMKQKVSDKLVEYLPDMDSALAGI